MARKTRTRKTAPGGWRPTPQEALALRCGELKRRLVAFAQSPALAEERAAYLDGVEVDDAASPARYLDPFVLGHRLDDGRTVLEAFVAQDRTLSERERAIVLGWRDRIDGVFRVEARAPDHLRVRSLIDDQTYVVRASTGRRTLDALPDGGFLFARLVPVEGDWLFSGELQFLPPAAEEAAMEAAAELAQRAPRLLFRNPRVREEAFALQREEAAVFVERFGGPDVAVPGRELRQVMRTYVADRARRLHPDLPAPPDEIADRAVPGALLPLDDVGVIYDPKWGLLFCVDYGRVRDVFREGRLDDESLALVREYAEDPDLAPPALLVPASRWPEHASRIFARLYDRPDFDWARDGEALLRGFKPDLFDPLPRTLPFRPELAEALRRARSR